MTEMKVKLSIEELSVLAIQDLREMYEYMYNRKPVSVLCDFYIQRIGYRLQELKYGGLNKRTQDFLENMQADSPIIKKSEFPVGTELVKEYRGKKYVVRVLSKGMVIDGKQFRTLSGVAFHITGQRISGRHFFGLRSK